MRLSRLALLSAAVAASVGVAPLAQAQVVDGRQNTARPQTAAWGGASVVLDVTRIGEGRFRDSEGRDHDVDRAQLRLGGNDEFELVIYGDSTYQFAGRWSGDLRFGPIPLDLREVFGRRVEGVGRAWTRDRSWDRDRSFDRVELDGWKGSYEFSLYFDAETRTIER